MDAPEVLWGVFSLMFYKSLAYGWVLSAFLRIMEKDNQQNFHL
jgi:hypothetical protein